jgi:DNA polymerase-1
MADSMPSSKRLFLIDGTALAYRSYFAFIRNPLINSKGINTSGAFGFTNTLMQILREDKPSHIACVFDASGPTFRHQTYPEYKATRQKMPDELAEQLPVIRNVVEAFNIPVYEIQGYEADDVIGTLAKKAEKEGLETYLITGDKDFMQLVSDRIKMMIPSQKKSGGEKEILGPDGVVKKLGVDPSKVTDLLGLMGDSSDNVPGIPGIGPKTAQELIEQFGSMESALSHTENIDRQKIRENLENYRDQALLSKELVTLKIDVPIDVIFDDLVFKIESHDQLVKIFQELEFNRFLQELPELLRTEKEPFKRDYRIVRQIEELDRLVKTLSRVNMFAIDLETTSLDTLSADIVGVCLSWKAGEATYIPIRMPGEDRSGDLYEKHGNDLQSFVFEKLQPILNSQKIKKCGQNIKYDMLVLRRHGIGLAGVDFDTMIAGYLINPTSRQFGIDALALEYLNIRKIPTKDLIGTGKNQISMAEVDLERVAEYGCEDADVTYQLRGMLEPKLKESKTEQLFREVEMPLMHVLIEMEENGVALDQKILSEMSNEMASQMDQLQEEIYTIAKEKFNINSTQQLGKILFEKLKVHELAGVKRPKRTKTGYATDVSTLERYVIHPLPKILLDYRQLTKLKSTYVDALPKLIHSKTGRVHASFNQTVTATGRLSTSDPNLQNIPIRTELGREIRKAFIPGQKDWVILSADYSQIELRIMAHISGDQKLIESFQKGEDVHRRTAAEIFGLSQDEVTKEHRRQAKTINFGIIYGMGPFGLSQRLGISLEEANSFISAYFARYPKVNAFIADMIGLAHKQGYVTTLLNRRRYLPELKSNNRNIREFGERTAINTPIQGTAADMIKIAMIQIAEQLRSEQWQAKMILQIHDELVFEAPSNEAEKLSKMVRKEMEGALKLSVPIKVDIGIGKNWYEAH